MTKILAVVPAYDEEDAIGPVVREIAAFDPSIDVVVVDDGSSDGTAAAAAAAGAAVVRLPFNVGIGGAVQTGFRYALEQGYELDRPSLVLLRAARKDAGFDIQVGGRVFPVARGELLTPQR